MHLTTRQEVEYFHLQFLYFLPMVLEPKLFCIKGGCNLRFFFSSIRYSEDLDLDVSTIAPKTLEKKIDKILKNVALISALQAVGLEISDVTKPKQTSTTQRWKMQLLSQKTGRKVHTKIEFSRRGIDTGLIIERVSQAVLDEYLMPRFSLPHYSKERAFAQKINALIHRTEPQARDVFDLDLLISQKSKMPAGEKLSPEEIKLATNTILEMSYEEYLSKVVAYLKPEHQIIYEDQELWGQIQLRIIKEIENNGAG
jgi:predicted nucleotidyltransferase component of viral defense system